MDRKDYLIFFGLFVAIALAAFSVSLQLSNKDAHAAGVSGATSKRSVEEFQQTSTDGATALLKRRADTLTRTLIKLQASIESTTRLSGNSGVTHVRSYSSGTQPYYQPSHSTDAILSIVRTLISCPSHCPLS